VRREKGMNGQIIIGQYTIRQDESGDIWIWNGDSEGGRFSNGKLEEVVDKFFKGNF
jgi:hypothetical protein